MAEYEPITIRHAVVQCPHCKNWFNIMDCTDKFNWSKDELAYKVFWCPKCEERFSSDTFDLNIEEKYHEDFPKTIKKKVSWD